MEPDIAVFYRPLVWRLGHRLVVIPGFRLDGKDSEYPPYRCQRVLINHIQISESLERPIENTGIAEQLDNLTCRQLTLERQQTTETDREA